MAVETLASRYNREFRNLKDDRKLRGYDTRSQDRRSRDFVNPATVAVAANGTVTGTVGAKRDNVPAGFNVTTFEAGIKYLPDRDDNNAATPA
jgi:hypothetical protein